VARFAEQYWVELGQRYGASAMEPPVVILCPDTETMRRGWLRSSGERSVGLYWGGVVRLLQSPTVPAFGRPGGRAVDCPLRGPLIHEMAHYYLDVATRGNYPVWFSEGVAQYEEWRATGFAWREAEIGASCPGYEYRSLESDFFTLPDTALAYRQSFLMVRYIRRVGGERALAALVRRLGAGSTFERALQAVTGMDTSSFDRAWRAWWFREKE